jgi:hypothetical protein
LRRAVTLNCISSSRANFDSNALSRSLKSVMSFPWYLLF